MKIGFIGLGHMGLPMAINLIKAGHQVVGFDLQADALTALAKAGGTAAKTLQETAVDQDVILTMLQTGQQVQQVCFGKEGLFAQARRDALYIDCSTIDVQQSREIYEQATKHNLVALDAPVSGGVVSAANATLTFMVGGTEQAYQAGKPLLSCMGQSVIHTGAAGSGQAAKICNNMILGVSMIAVSEAFVLAKNLGLTPQKLHEVVSHSSGQCWVMDRYVPVPDILENVPANHDYQAGFTAAMMLKDLHLSQSCAQAVSVDTPMTGRATQLYQQLNDEGMSGLDFSAIIKLLGS